MHAYVWLVLLLPLLAAAFIALRVFAGHDRGDDAERPTTRVSLAAVSAALLLLLGLNGQAWQSGWTGYVHVADWFASGSLKLPIAFMLDGLALPMAALSAFLLLLTQRFAASYLHREVGYHRFFIAMNLFTAGMLLIMLAGNAVLTFVGWELAGVSSWLLIGYAYDRQTATGNALRAFVTNRVGDAGLVLGIALAFSWLGTVEWPQLTAARGLDTLAISLLALGFVVAALAKSAQVPFAPWIARALEGPTPSSAIFYGAVMVHAGVYLLLRLEPLLRHAPSVMALIAVLGGLTAVYGWLSGLVQTDVKSSLMFSTTTQVGLMFLACGLGLFQLAAWHLAAHAVWRAYQFLSSPAYMHTVEGEHRPAPGWLAGRARLYRAALQRFWLEALTDWLLLRPTQALSRDVRDLDDQVVSRLVGLPDKIRVAAFSAHPEGDEIIRGHGLAGGLMAWLAAHLHRFELRLVLQPGGGAATRLLTHIGNGLKIVEGLLERPRYLLLLVMATFVVIL